MPPPEGAAVHEGLFTMGPEPRLLGSQCRDCNARQFPRTDTCPYCGSSAPEDVELAPTGRLWAWTTVSAAPPGYDGPVPFGFGVVELDGGPRVVTRLTRSDADALSAGQPMHLVLTPVSPPDAPVVLSWSFAPDGEAT
ncbi:MAG: OB-fold domain-containing protein [Acidimicrobiales bacterium]|nr:OB-fold domain-containing protein [Acidimicrobiales bacterium]